MGKRILAIDDDPDILEVYTLILEEEGYEVLTILSPDNLLYVIRDFNPDLILLDIQLGGANNGLEVCKLLKSSNITQHIPVFMVSAHESLHRAVREFNADGAIQKPFDLSDIITKINDFLLAKVIPIWRISA